MKMNNKLKDWIPMIVLVNVILILFVIIYLRIW